jgi:glycosyltransferase involved in cell wall biosynthesis
MKVSIALCTYNGENFIEEQLKSILEQSILPNEIVICDDRSTDNTLILIENTLANKNVTYKIIKNQQKLGVVRNFEKAISLSNGDYIFLCDQDDIWHENKIEVLLNYMDNHKNIDVVFTNAYLCGDKKGKLWDLISFTKEKQKSWQENGSLYTILRYKSICTAASMAIRNQAKEYLLPLYTAEDFIHDGLIAISAAINNRIDFLDQCLYSYRIHNEQWSAKVNKDKSYSFNQMLENKCAYLDIFIKRYNIKDKQILNMFNHYLTRKNRESGFAKRLKQLLPELINGNYSRYSNGLKSMVGDIIR